MTVCIGAICGDKSVIGASDRMRTGGLIEYEPESSKILLITNSIVALIAGETSVHARLIPNIAKYVNDSISREPQRWINVLEIAERYADEYSQLRRRSAETEILKPVFLDCKSFIEKQNGLQPEFVGLLHDRLQGYRIQDIEAIIIGVDSSGPHVFRIDNDRMICGDNAGFLAIGIGGWHASSHMMNVGHCPHNDEIRTLMAVHQAKKKAEVAPGIGKETDMFIIGPNLGSYRPFERDWIQKLDKIHVGIIESTEAAYVNGEKDLQEFVANQAMLQKSQAAAGTKKGPSPEPPKGSS